MARRNRSVRVVIGAVALMTGVGCGSPGQDPEGTLGSTEQAQLSGPDFVVSAVTGPASSFLGEDITTQVTVCNQGSEPADTMVDVYLSVDKVITPHGAPEPLADTFIGSKSTGYLHPGQCETLKVHGYASVLAEGAYYLGAVADAGQYTPEANESNNTRTGGLIGIGSGPDFVVSSVTGPTSAEQGGNITPQVKVCNQGTEPGSTRVDVYVSADKVITPPVPPAPPTDFLVGTRYTDMLWPGQCDTLPIQGSAWGETDGAYWLGAVVDPDGLEEELIEENNTRVGSRIGLGWGPDLVVSAVSGPVSAFQGQQLTAQVTVCNQGTSSAEGRVDLILSSDSVIAMPEPSEPPEPPTDFLLGWAQTDYLHPGHCQTLSIQGSAWSGTEGAHWLGAIVDGPDFWSELIEDNNTKVGNRIGVGQGPDFVVSSVTGPASSSMGGQLTTQVKVCNQGTSSGATQVDVFLSADAIIDPSVPSNPLDLLVGSAFTDWLHEGQCQTLSVSGSAWVPTDGAYWLGAIVDRYQNEQELIEDNNTKVGGVIGIGERPDFVVSAVTGPASTQPGVQFAAKVTVCNQGTHPRSARVDLLLSSDATIVAPSPQLPYHVQDQVLESAYTDSLHPGQCLTVPFDTSADVYEYGAWYLGAVVDPDDSEPELIEDNNSKAGGRIGIGWESDFVVSAVTGPASTPSQPFTASVTVCNQGTRSNSTDVSVYLSRDRILTPSAPGVPYSSQDFFVGAGFTDSIAPGQCETVEVEGSSGPDEGAFYLAALVDSFGYVPELIEDNNSRIGGRIGVGYGADFVVSSVTGPASAQNGSSITTSVTVCNQGTAGGTTRVDVFTSSDAVIAAPVPPIPPHLQDQFVGSHYTDYLHGGQCQTLSIEGSAYGLTDGAYYLGAIADPTHQEPELIEDNNSKAGNRIGLGFRADLVVSSVTGPASALPGSQISAQVTVCNQGTDSASSLVHVFVSSDNLITAPVPHLPPHLQDQILGSAYSALLQPGQCQTLPVQGAVWPEEEGPYYLGAIVDLDNQQWELIEDNNTKVGNRIGIGQRPDFVVSSVTGPASALPGSPISAQVKVCNQGTQGDITRVGLFLSKDAVISAPVPYLPPDRQDLLIQGADTGFLNPGQCQTLSIQGSIWAPTEGAWYLGAIVDPDGNLPELIEDNNGKAGNRIGIGQGADFVVSTVTGPASAQRGQNITLTVKVCNQGTQGESTRVGAVLSSDKTISLRPEDPPELKDWLVAYQDTALLSPGQCQTLSLWGPAWANRDGAWYLGAVADLDNNSLELIEDNNTKAGALIALTP